MSAIARRRTALLAGAVLAWGIAAWVLPEGLPPGILLRGLLAGVVIALPAAGIVLAYQATRVVNLAQAQLGVVGAVLAIELRLAWAVPYPVAVVAGLALAAAIGAAVEVLVLRRLRRAPSLVPLVATLGVAQLLAGSAMLLDQRIRTPRGRSFTAPVNLRLTVVPITFDASDLLVGLVGSAALVVVALLLTRTDLGLALRALASDRERASLSGIAAGPHAAFAWAVAGALSALALVLQAPQFVTAGAAAAATTGSALLLRALTAAVVGRFSDLPRAVAAAVAIGTIEEAIAWTTPNTTAVDALLLLGVLVALFTQRRQLGRFAGTGLAGWQPAPTGGGRDGGPSPKRLWVPVLIIAAALPAVLGPARTEVAGLVLIQAIVVVSLVVLGGWMGELSLGQFAVAGTGGAVTALLYGRHGWDLLLAIPTGMAAAAVVLVVLALPGLRGGGLLTAISTFGFAVAAHSYLFEQRYHPWFVQESVERPALWGRLALDRPWQVYLLALAVLAATVAAVTNIRRCRTGRALLAVRDNEASAAAVGIDPTRLRLFALTCSGVFAGLAGALHVLHQRGLESGSFPPETSVRLLAIAVVGGLSSMPGAVVAAVLFGAADYLLPVGWSLLASGIAMLGVLLFLPTGIGGLLDRLALLYAHSRAAEIDRRRPSSPHITRTRA